MDVVKEAIAWQLLESLQDQSSALVRPELANDLRPNYNKLPRGSSLGLLSLSYRNKLHTSLGYCVLCLTR